MSERLKGVVTYLGILFAIVGVQGFLAGCDPKKEERIDDMLEWYEGVVRPQVRAQEEERRLRIQSQADAEVRMRATATAEAAKAQPTPAAKEK